MNTHVAFQLRSDLNLKSKHIGLTAETLAFVNRRIALLVQPLHSHAHFFQNIACAGAPYHRRDRNDYARSKA
jgi:hypothetical protein